MTPRTPRRGRRTPPRRGRPNHTDHSARAALLAEPLEDRSQASATPTTLPPAPDLAAAIVAPAVVTPTPAAALVSHATADGPDLAHRLTSLDRAAADADQLAGVAPPQTSPVFAATPQSPTR